MMQIPIWQNNPWFYAEYYVYNDKNYTRCSLIHPFGSSSSWWIDGGSRPFEFPSYPQTPLVFKWIGSELWHQVTTSYLQLLIPFLAPAVLMKMAPWFKLKQRKMLTSIVFVFSLITLAHGFVSFLDEMMIWKDVTGPILSELQIFLPLMPWYLYCGGFGLAMFAGGLGIHMTAKNWWNVRKEHRIPKTVILCLISTVLLFLTMTIPIPWVKLQGKNQHPFNAGAVTGLRQPLIWSWVERGLWPQVIATFSIGLEPIVSMIAIGIASLVIRFRRKNLSSIAFLTPLLSCVMGLLSLIVFAEVASSVYASIPKYWYDPWRIGPLIPIPWHDILRMFISSLIGPPLIFLISGICSMIFGGLALENLWKSRNAREMTMFGF